MVANKYAFLQITRRRFLNEWEAFKKVISRRNLRRRITIPLTLSNLKFLRRITRTENILHRNFTRRQVAIQNRDRSEERRVGKDARLEQEARGVGSRERSEAAPVGEQEGGRGGGEVLDGARPRLLAAEAGQHVHQPLLMLREKRGAGGVEHDVADAAQGIADLRFPHGGAQSTPAAA